MSSASPSYKDYRCLVEIVAHCVRLHFRFPLGFREVEEPMLERGVLVSHEGRGGSPWRPARSDARPYAARRVPGSSHRPR